MKEPKCDFCGERRVNDCLIANPQEFKRRANICGACVRVAIRIVAGWCVDRGISEAIAQQVKDGSTPLADLGGEK